MTLGKPSKFIKPTLETKFHIDYDWWEKNPRDYRSYMLTHLAHDKQELFLDSNTSKVLDYIDPETGEVRQLDALQVAIQEAAAAPDFFNLQLSLVDSVFRVFLANNNTPQTPKELANKTGRSATVILKTFGGIHVYKGIRPIQES